MALGRFEIACEIFWTIVFSITIPHSISRGSGISDVNRYRMALSRLERLLPLYCTSAPEKRNNFNKSAMAKWLSVATLSCSIGVLGSFPTRNHISITHLGAGCWSNWWMASQYSDENSVCCQLTWQVTLPDEGNPYDSEIVCIAVWHDDWTLWTGHVLM